MKLPDHISAEKWARLKKAADQYQTPFQLIDLQTVAEKYQGHEERI